MIVLKRRPLPQRVANSYRAYRALGIGRLESLRGALITAIARKVPPRREPREAIFLHVVRPAQNQGRIRYQRRRAPLALLVRKLRTAQGPAAVSYPLDLDEMGEDRIKIELAQRERRRAAGRCDYCGRLPSSPSCKFPRRHNDARIQTPEQLKL